MIYKCKCFLSSLFILDCIDIICAFSTLALVFKATKKKKKRCSLLAPDLNRVSRFGREGVFSVIAPFGSVTGAVGCVRECAWAWVRRWARECVRVIWKRFSPCFEAFLQHTQRKHHVVVGFKGIEHWCVLDQRMKHDCNYEQFKLTHLFI